MNPSINRRAFILGGAGLITLAGGTSFLINQAQGSEALWVEPGEVKSSPSPPPSPTPPPFDLTAFDPAELVTITAAGWHSWALMDRQTKAIIGSKTMHENNRTCSMIKTWIAADYLAQKPNPSQTRLKEISIMIRDSDNASATSMMNEMGTRKSFDRLKAQCQTVDFVPGSSWGRAQISAYDALLMAEKIASGGVANEQWTTWLLEEMRNVRRGTWGVRAAFPEAERKAISIKNGWDITSEAGTYHANCLAVTPRWILCTLTKYPISVKANESHGATIGQKIAEQLLNSSELRPLFAAPAP